MLLATLFAGCAYYLPPTAFGLRGDAVLPPDGAWELAAQDQQFGEWQRLDQTPPTVSPQPGFQASARIGESRVGMRGNVGALVIGGQPLATAEGDVLVAVLEEDMAPLGLTASGGGSFLWYGATLPLAEPQVGVTASKSVADTLTPYVGARCNPYLASVGDTGGAIPTWLQLGGGVTWRPEIGKARGVLGLEGTWYHGFAVVGGKDTDTGVWSHYDMDTWGLAASVGVQVGGRDR